METDLTVYNYLKSVVSVCSLNTTRTQTTIRCPICGDSKNPTSAHLTIRNAQPFQYYCFKCLSSGIAKNLINELKINDNDFKFQLTKGYDSYLKNSNIQSSTGIGMKQYQPRIILPKSIGIVENKSLDYFEMRMGFRPNNEEITKFKLILNLLDFIELNKIKPESVSLPPGMTLEGLNTNYCMFLSADNNVIQCRYTGSDPNVKRFFKLTLNKHIETDRKFYVVGNTISLNNTVFNIHIAEGIFDILSVYKNIHNAPLGSNDIFIGNLGKGYLATLNFLLKMGITNASIHIYSDIEVTKRFYISRLRNSLLAKYNGFQLHYNTFPGEKDFGVHKDKIICSPGEYVKIGV